MAVWIFSLIQSATLTSAAHFSSHLLCIVNHQNMVDHEFTCGNSMHKICCDPIVDLTTDIIFTGNGAAKVNKFTDNFESIVSGHNLGSAMLHVNTCGQHILRFCLLYWQINFSRLPLNNVRCSDSISLDTLTDVNVINVRKCRLPLNTFHDVVEKIT